MQQAILIRVTPENYEVWRKEHDGQSEARGAFGMTDGPVYRDESDPNVTLVQLNVENMERAMEWFQSDAFKQAAQRAGKVQRELWLGQKRG